MKNTLTETQKKVKGMSTASIEARMKELDAQVFNDEETDEERDARLDEYRDLENELLLRKENN